MKKIVLLIGCLGGGGSLHAQQPFQASLTPDVAIFSRSTQIDGLSLSIWGENPQHGVALGLVNGHTDNSSGFSWGLVNYADSYIGVEWGVINYSKTEFIGWQEAWLNVSMGTFKGLQMGGILNYAEDLQGLQVGMINYAQNLSGVQLGFVNVAMNNDWFNALPDKLAPVFPFVNWSF